MLRIPSNRPPTSTSPSSEAGEAGVGEKLEWHAVGLRHVPGVGSNALARDLEGVRTGTSGGIVHEDLPCLAPPGGAVVRFEAAEPARIVHHLAGAADLVGGPRERVSHTQDEAGEPHDDDEHDRADEAAHDPAAVVGGEPRHGHLCDEDQHHHSADHCEGTEDRAVGDAVGARAAVLDECGPGERPPGHDERGVSESTPRRAASTRFFDCQSTKETTTSAAMRPARDCVSNTTSPAA